MRGNSPGPVARRDVTVVSLPGFAATTRPVPCSAGDAPWSASGPGLAGWPTHAPYNRLASGCRPPGCRAPARRVRGRRVRYVIGDEPGQVNGMRWHGPRR
ncbi:tryptophan biosynthesis modulator TrpM [Goodfellowiella coeruleoviolacea]|uniref:Tryptophan synthase subunit(Beta) n=1 Tax=Goodfellowiella coeruleoviolacea TaxID=334858 RepID=A0AAE3G9C5_9PSEU|nr:hypothetical protein [Goodfellowiella coeruleoviolacea]MCP2163284.1 hypothetical protein [Goodfellowiella coeruleoviolacea]